RPLLIRLPNVAVSGDINPAAVAVEIGSAGVILIRAARPVGFTNYAVTVAIPFVPIVFVRSGTDLVFRIVRPPNRNHLAFSYASAPLRRGNFRLAFADNHVR